MIGATTIAVELVGGPACGRPMVVNRAPDGSPFAVLPQSRYVLDGRTLITPAGAERPIYRWVPDPAGRRDPSPCTCGSRGCPNAGKPAPPSTPPNGATS